jgi:6-phosphogluconolactonase/glucosamine-6-phosphate isomerase/deaminase
MTLAAFNKASVILFLVARAGKAGVVRAILDPKTEAEEGRVIWFLDRAAAAELPIH